MAAEDWPEEEEEGWSVEGMEVGRGLVAVETSEELGTVSAVRASEELWNVPEEMGRVSVVGVGTSKGPCEIMEASGELG